MLSETSPLYRNQRRYSGWRGRQTLGSNFWDRHFL